MENIVSWNLFSRKAQEFNWETFNEHSFLEPKRNTPRAALWVGFAVKKKTSEAMRHNRGLSWEKSKVNGAETFPTFLRAGEWHCKLLHRATLNLTYFTFYWLFWVSFSLPLRWKKTIMILYCLELGFLSSRLLTSRSSWAVFLIFLFRSFPFFHYTTHNYKQNERCCNMLYKRLNVCFRAFSFLSLH